MDFMGLIGNLKTHEMEKKVTEDKVLPKKKNIAFKSSQILLDDNENIDNEGDDDEELPILVKNVRRMFHKCERFNNVERQRNKAR